MIDCIQFNYPHLYAPTVIEGVRLESIPDIIAMKLSAIAQNGTRIKDFIDIATLSTLYSFEEMLDFYISKFPKANVLMPIKALTYFDEQLPLILEKMRDEDILLITADHGNCELMWDENGDVVTSHTTNLVPFIVTKKDIELIDGNLCDIAPTILKIMMQSHLNIIALYANKK